MRPNPQVLLAELSDGTAVLLHLESLFYFSLNETGVAVWKALSAGRDEDEIAGELAREFEVAADDARRDVEKLLAELRAERLVLSEGAAP